MAARIIIILCWAIMSLMTMIQYADVCAKVESSAAKLLAGIIFIIGGPIFCAYTALSGLLDYILPEGWEDDDDDTFKH